MKTRRLLGRGHSRPHGQLRREFLLWLSHEPFVRRMGTAAHLTADEAAFITGHARKKDRVILHV